MEQITLIDRVKQEKGDAGEEVGNQLVKLRNAIGKSVKAVVDQVRWSEDLLSYNYRYGLWAGLLENLELLSNPQDQLRFCQSTLDQWLGHLLTNNPSTHSNIMNRAVAEIEQEALKRCCQRLAQIIQRYSGGN